MGRGLSVLPLSQTFRRQNAARSWLALSLKRPHEHVEHVRINSRVQHINCRG